jgi:hypothetical protein
MAHKLEFFTELKEARMFRGPAGLRGQHAWELARVFYVSLLALELVRQEDEEAARLYAYRSINFADYDHMRMGSTDLANLASVLSNQNDYEDRIQVDFDIYAPVLQVQSYLQGVRQKMRRHGLDRQFFITLENVLHIHDSTLWSIRRTVMDWNISSRMEKHMAVSNMRREIARHALLLDIAELLPNL